ncbi:hypothetical protein HDU76_007155 [Blyttiomyces sp. JEL0837]|nr:hypothetical protein HDU76_007155 [Blyttiomyces sp. JEL0837]
MRLIPIAIDVVLLATLLASVKRVGNFGDAVLDTAISIAQQYPHLFEKRSSISPTSSNGGNNATATFTSAATSAVNAVAGALGLGGDIVPDGYHVKVSSGNVKVAPAAQGNKKDAKRMSGGKLL